MANEHRFDLTFLGSGNAFGSEGRAFSCFLLDGRYMFDCGPTVLQQLRRSGTSSHDIAVVLVSHFHGDHFFGLPFLILDAWHEGRTQDLHIVGPPGIEARAEQLLETAFPHIGERAAFKRVYTEVCDSTVYEVAGLNFRAGQVDHVPGLECFAYRVESSGRTLVFSGDARLCDGLLRLAAGADVLVLECSCVCEPVHLSPEGVAQVAAQAAPGAQTIVTHLDDNCQPEAFRGLHVATDLARFRL